MGKKRLESKSLRRTFPFCSVYVGIAWHFNIENLFIHSLSCINKQTSSPKIMYILTDVCRGWRKKHWVSFRERAINLGGRGNSYGKASKNKRHLGWLLRHSRIEFFLVCQPSRPVSKINDWVQQLTTLRKLHCYGYKNSTLPSCWGKIMYISLQNGLVSSIPVIGLPTLGLSYGLNSFLNLVSQGKEYFIDTNPG